MAMKRQLLNFMAQTLELAAMGVYRGALVVASSLTRSSMALRRMADSK